MKNKILVTKKVHLSELSKKERKSIVLAGNVAFNRFYTSLSAINHIDGYVLQQPLPINGGWLACYIPESVVSELKGSGSNIPVTIASHSNYRVSKANAGKTSRFIAFFFHKNSNDDEFVASIWFFNKGKVIQFEEKNNISGGYLFNAQVAQLITGKHKAEWKDAKVVVYGNDPLVQDLESGIAQELNLTISKQELFKNSSLINNFDKLEPVLKENYKEKKNQKTIKVVIVSLAILLIAYSGSKYLEYEKSNSFLAQKRIYAQKNRNQMKSFTTSDLELWQQRKFYLETRNDGFESTDIMAIYLKALSYVHNKSNIIIDKIEINKSLPFRENGKAYNTKFIIGIKAISDDAEFDVKNALGVFVSSMGSYLASDVEVWDRITTKTVNGVPYRFIVFYADFKAKEKRL